MTTTKYLTRFAPSPTGMMHIGNARTALFNALLALKNHADFLLRIEDTDRVRSEQQYADILQQDLKWLGINWQQGPYWQSQRQDIYEHYYQLLEEEGLIYPCFCSEEQLALNRKLQRAAGKPPRYPGSCCSLTKAEIEAKLAAGIKPTLRFRVPEDHQIKFTDLVRGEQCFNSNDIGDFIVKRADGSSSFMFCSVIDDALMGVSHILRGEDHLTNTPRQLLILRALNLPEPQYGHISLIMGGDGAPLAKRSGSRSLGELREEGYLPLALTNYLARLGHHYSNDDLMSLDELAANFSLDSLGHAPARFDINQLKYWQKQALAKSSALELKEWLGQQEYSQEFIDAVKGNAIFRDDFLAWAAIFYGAKFNYDESQKALIKDTGALYFQTALKALNEYGSDLNTLCHTLAETLSIKGKALYLPLRIALTGREHGPEMAKIFQLLGEDKVKERLELALNLLHQTCH